MANKFKVGDRVRITHESYGVRCNFSNKPIGYEFMIAEISNDYCREYKDRLTGVHETLLELLTTQYTPISPKVGEKYRVLKDFWGKIKGEIVTITKIRTDGRGFVEDESGFCLRGVTDYLTTEYLELVSEPEREKLTVSGVDLTVVPTGGGIMEEIANYQFCPAPKTWSEHKLPDRSDVTNQSIITKVKNYMTTKLATGLRGYYPEKNMELSLKLQPCWSNF